MNRTSIEWTDFTWNPMVGCQFLCEYCYAWRMARRKIFSCPTCNAFIPNFHPERLNEPSRIKRPSKIFVCSMGELFGSWIPVSWIRYILNETRDCPHHTFQFLTKNPARLKKFSFGENCWIGTTIEKPENLWRMKELLKAMAPVRFVSFEPLLGDMGNLDLRGVDWVIIGAMTGPRAIKPLREWVQGILTRCWDFNVPVFVKDNVSWPWRIQEWPKDPAARLEEEARS